MKLLSILICTIPSRLKMFESLISNLHEQVFYSEYKDDIQICYDNAVGITTGAKRNKLLEMASGKFSVFIDDDDIVSNDYVKKIADCIKQNPDIDCVGIQGTIITNESHVMAWEISKDFGNWHEANNKYYRTPNHISPIRTELCLQAKFPDITIGEDSEFSKRVLPLLKKEAKVAGDIYIYRYTNNQINNQHTHEFPYRPAWR